jgi:hypothetical protein
MLDAKTTAALFPAACTTASISSFANNMGTLSGIFGGLAAYAILRLFQKSMDEVTSRVEAQKAELSEHHPQLVRGDPSQTIPRL